MTISNVYAAFPDFDRPFPVEIPKGFVDDSCGDDCCPSFFNKKLQLEIWIDYENPEQRDMGFLGRFSLEWLSHAGSGVAVVHSDDFADILLDIKRIRSDFAMAKSQIIKDVLDGRVHPSVNRFEQLGEYVDNNDYGCFTQDDHPVWEAPYSGSDGHMTDRGVAVINAVHSAVDHWLVNGGIPMALADKLCIKRCDLKHDVEGAGK